MIDRQQVIDLTNEWLADKETEFTLPVEGGGFCDGYDVQWAKLIGEAPLDQPLAGLQIVAHDSASAQR